MEMRHGIGIVVQVKGLVGVVVVTGLLKVHRHVRQPIGTLRHGHRAEHRHGLPHKDRQQHQGTTTTKHGGQF
jgi:hypothetical protein